MVDLAEVSVVTGVAIDFSRPSVSSLRVCLSRRLERDNAIRDL